MFDCPNEEEDVPDAVNGADGCPEVEVDPKGDVPAIVETPTPEPNTCPTCPSGEAAAFAVKGEPEELENGLLFVGTVDATNADDCDP